MSMKDYTANSWYNEPNSAGLNKNLGEAFSENGDEEEDQYCEEYLNKVEKVLKKHFFGLMPIIKYLYISEKNNLMKSMKYSQMEKISEKSPQNLNIDGVDGNSNSMKMKSRGFRNTKKYKKLRARDMNPYPFVFRDVGTKGGLYEKPKKYTPNRNETLKLLNSELKGVKLRGIGESPISANTGSTNTHEEPPHIKG